MVAYSYIARREALPPGTMASDSESNTSKALELRCFHMIKEVAFSRIVVLINVGFGVQIMVEIIKCLPRVSSEFKMPPPLVWSQTPVELEALFVLSSPPRQRSP